MTDLTDLDLPQADTPIERIRQIDPDDVEFWSARDLMMVLESIPEDLPNANSIKKLERAEKKRLAAPISKPKKD